MPCLRHRGERRALNGSRATNRSAATTEARVADRSCAVGATKAPTQQMAIFKRNPKGWAELLRCAALLVVAVLL